MDLLKLYYYTSVPLVTCNLLFYSISALSTSITSSQNVVKFIAEHKDCDSVIFQNEIQTNDTISKLKIIESLIYDILKKYSSNEDEFLALKHNLMTHNDLNEQHDDTKEYNIVEINEENKNILDNIDEPIRYALLSTSEIVQQLNNTLVKCNKKIIDYKQSYTKNIISLCLQKELNDFKKQTNILEQRFNLLVKLLQIYILNDHTEFRGI